MDKIQERIAQMMLKRRRQGRIAGHKILMALLEIGLNETWLAGRLDVSTSLLSLWKRGMAKIPEHWQGELHKLLAESLSNKPAVIGLVKREVPWDSEMQTIIRQQFRAAQKVLDEHQGQEKQEAA